MLSALEGVSVGATRSLSAVATVRGAACVRRHRGRRRAPDRIVPADLGLALRVVARLEGAAGAPVVTAPSAPRLPVQPAALPVTLPVTLSGLARVGNALRLSYDPVPGATIVYRWQRCAASCVTIEGQVGISYTPTGSDVGTRIVGAVQAVTRSASATYTSDPSPVVR